MAAVLTICPYALENDENRSRQARSLLDNIPNRTKNWPVELPGEIELRVT